MTRITRIKLNGFKSFPKSVEIPFEADFATILGPNGSGKCLVYDSLVQLEDGSLIKIGDLVEEKLSKNRVKKIDDGYIGVSDGLKVAYLDLKDLKIKSKKILNYIKRESPDYLLKTTTRSGRSVTSTKYHPLFTLKDNIITPLKAEELKTGIRIAVPRYLDIKTKTKYFVELLDLITPEDRIYVSYKTEFVGIIKKHKTTTWKEFADGCGVSYFRIKGFLDKQSINFAYLVKILRFCGLNDYDIIKLIPTINSSTGKSYKMVWENSPDFSRFLGYLIAEGRLPSTSDQIWFVNSCQEMVEDYVNIAQKLFGDKPTINEYKDNCYDVLFYSTPIRRILNKFGMPCANTEYKDLTNLFLSHSSRVELAEFLNGLFSGDGYVGKNGIEITTKSKKLGFAIENILARLGITFSSKYKVKIATNSGFSGIYRTINIYGVENFRKFNSNINLKHPQKKEKLSKLLNVKSNPNVDLIELNKLVKDVAVELKLNVKKLKKHYPKLSAYVYNGCLPSRNGLIELTEQVFKKSALKSSNLELLKKIAYSDIFWDEVVEIEEIKSDDKWVYDLCVEGDHNFIANNIIVHNSNISDAVCFVLGRLSSKALRAEKSSHLIYNGGKTNPPSKQAEVSIFFDNAKKDFALEDKEIKLTRIVKQSGQSVYKINDKMVTRQQVLDLLSLAKINPEGYNIVMQGDIVKFMEMKTEERRAIIEDIAGISVYEDKKQKALHELEGVQTRLSEAEIILTERETNLRELKKDRDQAIKYQEANQNIKDNKATLVFLQLRQKETKRDEFDSKIKDFSSKIDSINKQIEQNRLAITAKKQEIKQINEDIEQKGERDSLVLRKEVEGLKTDIIRYNAREETLSSEIKKIDERKIQLVSSIEESNKEISSLKEKRKQLELSIKESTKAQEAILKEIKVFREKNMLDDVGELTNKVEGVEQEIEEAQTSIIKLQEQKAEYIRTKDKSEWVIGEIEKKELRLKEAQKENKDKSQRLKDLRLEFKNMVLDISKTQNEYSSLLSSLSNARKKYFEQNQELQTLASRRIGIREGMSDQAIKKIKSLSDKKVYGTVSELGSVPTKYSLALEVAAGPRINSIVVEDDTTAARLIKVLKDNKAGIATFLPLNKIKSRLSDSSMESIKKSQGVIGLGVDLIKFSPKFKDVFSYVFGNTLVVESVEVARRIGIGRARMVSLEGDLMEVSGAMIGGFRKREGLGFSKQELDLNISVLEVEVKRLQEIIDNLEQKSLVLDENLTQLKKKKSELEAQIVGIERTLGIVYDDEEAPQEKSNHQSIIKDSDRKIKDISTNILKLETHLKKLKEQKEELRVKITPDASLGSKLRELEDKRDLSRDNIISQRGELNNILTQIERIHTPEVLRIQKIIRDQEKEKEVFKVELLDLATIIKQKSFELKQKEKQESEFYGKFKMMAVKRNKLNDLISKTENSMVLDLDRIKELQGKLNNINIEKAKIVSEIEGLNKENEAYKDAKIKRSVDIDALKSEIKDQEKILASLGAVNLRALEIYEGLQKELGELQDKVTKLKVEKEDVLKMISEIEQNKKEIFMKTFNEIALRFNMIYLEIATKWEAFLELENVESPFEGGVNIKVRITHNKYLDIKGLSGGEKTLCALSFIFAIQEFEPASFYLFDEVDAALDKQNSEKLSHLISKYSNRAQYIVITHNDAIISEANKIYGVSMQNGVSKVVTLKV